MTDHLYRSRDNRMLAGVAGGLASIARRIGQAGGYSGCRSLITGRVKTTTAIQYIGAKPAP